MRGRTPRNLKAGVYKNPSNGSMIQVLPFENSARTDSIQVRVIYDAQNDRATGRMLNPAQVNWSRFEFDPTTCCLWNKHPVFCNCLQ